MLSAMFGSVASARAFWLALTYAAAASLWVILSDVALQALVPDTEKYAVWSIVKGWGFVGVSATVLFLIARTLLKKQWSESSKYRRILQCVSDGVYGINLNGRCTFANQALADMLGYDGPQEIVGQDMHSLMHYQRPDGTDYPVNVCPIHGHLELESSFRKVRQVVFQKDGTAVPVTASREPLTDDAGTLIGAVIELSDISPLEDAQRRAADEAAFSAHVLETANTLLVVLDKNGRIKRVNKMTEEFLGEPSSALVGSDWFDHFIPEEELAACRGVFEDLQRRGASPTECENAVMAKDGRQHIVAWRNSFLPDLTDTGHMAVCFGIDITQLRTTVRDLEASQVELGKAKEAAELANRLKSEFLANVSHELRTPLNAILGFSDLIRSEVFGPIHPNQYKSYIDDIHESGTILLDLVSDIVDISVVEAGHLTLEMGEINLRELVHQAVQIAHFKSTKKHISIDESYREAEIIITADERRIKQVLINLFNNAIKFTPDKGKIGVTVGRDDCGDLRVTVWDTGIGIPKDQIDNVLSMFGRGSDAYVRTQEGAGLGLPLCVRLVEAHGGRIDIHSTPGQGTQVTMTLPAGCLVAAVN